MGWTWKSRPISRRSHWGPFTRTRTERFGLPDRTERITMWWFGRRVTLWER